MRTQRRSTSFGGAFVVVLTALLMLLAGCVPRNKGETSAVRGADDSSATEAPPVFPEGDIPAGLLAKGLTYDFMERPFNQDYWAPGRKEAKCMAKSVVKDIGAQRLSTLGYRVATVGAGLNDIDLTNGERESVADLMMTCVDMREGVAAVFFGAGRMSTREALCLSDSLKSENLLRPFAEAWAFGQPVESTDGDSALASALSTASQVCISVKRFNWPFLRFPGEETEIIDSDAPAGSRSSAYADDRPRDDKAFKATTTTVAGN